MVAVGVGVSVGVEVGNDVGEGVFVGWGVAVGAGAHDGSKNTRVIKLMMDLNAIFMASLLDKNVQPLLLYHFTVKNTLASCPFQRYHHGTGT